MTPRATICSLLALLLALVLGPGRADADSGPEERWIVDRWTMREGMPQNSVTDLLQARDGSVWLTTYGGVARFDGREFQVLHSGNTRGLEAERFLSIAQDAEGGLWFGSESQGVFRYLNGVATRVGPPGVVWDLAVGPEGGIWAVHGDGLMQLWPTEPRAVPLEHPARVLNTMPSGALLASGAGGWTRCVVGDCGVVPVGPAIKSNATWLKQPDGRFLVGGADAVYEQRAGGWVARFQGGGIEHRAILCAQWVGGPWCVFGANPFAVSELPAEAQGHLPPSGEPRATALLRDGEGGLWVGSDGGGLARFQPRPARRHGPEAGIFSVAPAPGGGVWYTDTDTAYAVGAEIPPALAAVPQAWLWSAGDGVVLAVSGAKGWVLRAGPDGRVQTQDLGVQGELSMPNEGPWFGIDDALYEVPPGGVARRVTSAQQLGGSTLRPLRGAGPGSVWLVLDEAELLLWRAGEVVRRVHLHGRRRVRDLLDRGSRLWLATYGGGLVAVEGEAVLGALTPEEGLCDYMVSRIFDAGAGELWINTNRGLGRVYEAELEAALPGGELSSCTLVGTEEGNGAAGAQTADGRIWAATIAGLAEVDPRAVADARPPRLVLEIARYGDADLLRGQPARGPGGLRVRYAGLLYAAPYAVRYRYRLLGESSQWSELAETREVHFSNLPPGDYRLEIEARGLGAWSGPESLSFTRRPLWWERPSARIGLPLFVAALLLGGLGLGLARSQLQNRALREEVRERERAQEALTAQQAENDRIQRVLEATRRLEGLGRLAGGVAHDFNNLLTVVAVHGSLLEEHPDPRVRTEGKRLLEVVERGSALTRGLLVFGKSQPDSAQVVDLGLALGEISPMLRRLIRADIALHVSVEEGAAVRIDPGRLDQILTNLVLNARDAIQDHGRIEVTVRRTGQLVRVVVRDDGVGFSGQPEEAFEPFVTTKEPGKGSGLGLTTVREAVREAGGEVVIESAPGGGTTVVVRLPSAKAAPSRRAALPSAALPAGLLVLVVEDRPEVRGAIVLLLERLRCVCHSAADIEGAARIAREIRLDLLLTDLVMPESGGREVRLAVQALQPGLPALYMSGYADDLLDAHDDATPLLRKPFTPDEFVAAAMAVLPH